MDLLKQIQKHAEQKPWAAAYQIGEFRMTYGELSRYSDAIAGWLLREFPGDKRPVAVYGHKHPMMAASFLGCAKAGRAYCPLDQGIPEERVRTILKMADPSAVIIAAPDTVTGSLLSGSGACVLSWERLNQLAEQDEKAVPEVCSGESWLSGEDIVYIIFTSGSTGQPKGVQIPYSALCSFVEWAGNLGGMAKEKQGGRFLNQAPFSFDLSVMDLYTCLYRGGTLFPLDKAAQNSYSALFHALKESDPTVWVSTPSFAELCLADKEFARALMPSLRTFLFCGERLTNTTALKLLERFPDAEVVNTYGPTESTVAVTSVPITEEMCRSEELLPVGRAKPGCCLYIAGEDGKISGEGEPGEIIITGDTLSAGYLKDQEQTDRAFRTLTPGDGEKVRAYFTGDEGYLRDGMLYFNGRIDQQIKLHGYRIELGDIESNLLRIPGVSASCVVPSFREGRVNSLTAAVCMDGNSGDSGRQKAREIKNALRVFLPEYMIPKKIVFLDKMPLTANGKADRQAVRRLCTE